MSKSILFINQSSGYLMIDIINAHVPYYDNIVLLTGFLNPRETPLNAKVKIYKLTEYKRTSSFLRLYTWLSFWLKSLYYILFKFNKSNLYFVSNPPLNIFSAKWARERDIAFLFYDLYPQAFLKNGLLKKSSWLYQKWIKANQDVCCKSKRLFILSEGMKKGLNLNDKEQEKLKVVPVWTNNSFFEQINKKDNLFIKEQNLQNKFVIGYSGNLGKTHPVEKIIELAQLFSSNDEIIFLIIGDGEKKAQLNSMQNNLNLPNLKILDFQPTKIFSHVLASFDIGIVTLEEDATDLSVPSKTFNLMSARKPIISIAGFKSELAKIVINNKIGQNFKSDDLKKMKTFIFDLKSNKDLYKEYSENCYKASLNFTPKNAKKMILN